MIKLKLTEISTRCQEICSQHTQAAVERLVLFLMVKDVVLAKNKSTKKKHIKKCNKLDSTEFFKN